MKLPRYSEFLNEGIKIYNGGYGRSSFQLPFLRDGFLMRSEANVTGEQMVRVVEGMGASKTFKAKQTLGDSYIPFASFTPKLHQYTQKLLDYIGFDLNAFSKSNGSVGDNIFSIGTKPDKFYDEITQLFIGDYFGNYIITEIDYSAGNKLWIPAQYMDQTIKKIKRLIDGTKKLEFSVSVNDIAIDGNPQLFSDLSTSIQDEIKTLVRQHLRVQIDGNGKLITHVPLSSNIVE